MQTTIVEIGDRSYPIIVAANRFDRLASMIRKLARGGRLFTLIDAQVLALYRDRIIETIKRSHSRCDIVAIPQGERAKSATEAGRLYDLLLAQNISRGDAILVFGGGVATDLAGYVASTILRGVRWGAVPTTLLGMVDAAIGGKTAINHRSGKNLIGTLWHPQFVYCDLSFLMTLPERELIAGIGEIAKSAGIAGGNLLTPLERYIDEGRLLDLRALKKLVEQSVEVKARIVSADEQETGKRMTLNFGHTYAHAIERSLGYGRLRHGEAVILGIRAALFLGEREGNARIGSLKKYTELVDALVSLVPRRKINESTVLNAMVFDKKRKKGRMRFVLLERLGAPKVVDNVSPHNAGWALRQMLRQYETGGGRYVKDSGS